MGFELFLAAAAVLTGIDVYLSHKRMKTYGSSVELDFVARRLGRDCNTQVAMAWLGLKNLAMLLLIDKFHWDTWLHVLVGAKAGLCMLQLKSLQLEKFIEVALARGKSNGK